VHDAGAGRDHLELAERLLAPAQEAEALAVAAELDLDVPGERVRMTLTVLMREEILAGGRLTPGRLDSCTAELREHLSQPGTLTCLPTIWQAWGHKPAAS
jgi:hypothetical protein